MGWLHFSSLDMDVDGLRRSTEFVELTAYSVIGLVCWTAATAALYSVTSLRFRRMTNRTDRMLSDKALAEMLPLPRRPRQGPLVAPWAPPSQAVVLEEVEEDTTEPLDHDDDRQRYRPT
jgi:hypothetical protein